MQLQDVTITIDSLRFAVHASEEPFGSWAGTFLP